MTRPPNPARNLMLHVDAVAADDDDFDDYLADRLSDPQFAASFEDASQRSRLVADLIACRKAHGLRQREVAAHMRVAQSVVSEFEHGTDSHLSTLQRYARSLGARLSVKIEMPADQRWADNVGRPYRPGETHVRAGTVVKPPESVWLNHWAGQARSQDEAVKASA